MQTITPFLWFDTQAEEVGQWSNPVSIAVGVNQPAILSEAEGPGGLTTSSAS